MEIEEIIEAIQSQDKINASFQKSIGLLTGALATQTEMNKKTEEGLTLIAKNMELIIKRCDNLNSQTDLLSKNIDLVKSLIK